MRAFYSTFICVCYLNLVSSALNTDASDVILEIFKEFFKANSSQLKYIRKVCVKEIKEKVDADATISGKKIELVNLSRNERYPTESTKYKESNEDQLKDLAAFLYYFVDFFTNKMEALKVDEEEIGKVVGNLLPMFEQNKKNCIKVIIGICDAFDTACGVKERLIEEVLEILTEEPMSAHQRAKLYGRKNSTIARKNSTILGRAPPVTA